MSVTEDPRAAKHAAVYLTVSYADMFDRPIHIADLHRNLIQDNLTLLETSLAVDYLVAHGHLARIAEDLICLPGREPDTQGADYPTPRPDRDRAGELWGRIIGRVPLVRMVAITGQSRSQEPCNNETIDFFVVSRPRRLWLTRHMINQVAKRAERHGTSLQISMMLSSRSLAISEQDLHIASELAHMRVIVGSELCEGVRRCNSWIFDYLPNSSIAGDHTLLSDVTPSTAQKWVEWVLLLPPFRPIENWLRRREIKRLAADTSKQEGSIDTQEGNRDGAAFSPDRCPGHLVRTSATLETAWQERLASLEHTPVQ